MEIRKELTFVEKYIRGLSADPEEILHHISLWHDSNTDLPLHEFLGLTEEEHLAFVESDDILKRLLNEKRARYRRSTFTLIVNEEYSAAVLG